MRRVKRMHNALSTKFGYAVVSADPEEAIEQAVVAEKNGFDTVWIPDHFVDIDGERLEPWSVLSAVAAKTKRIRLASAVTDTQRSHPARTAQAVACLDVISRGRAVLGIGAGEAMNIVPFGLPWESPRERVVRLAEAIQVIRMLWGSSRNKRVSFSGSYYKLLEAFLGQSPRQKPSPPIYVGVFSSKSALEVVGRLGDGWYGFLNTPQTFRNRWSTVRSSAEAAGRSARKIDPACHLLVAFPKNAEENKLALTAGKMNLLTERTVLRTLGHTIDPGALDYQNLLIADVHLAKLTSVLDSIPDDFVYRTMAIGDIGEVEERIDALAKSGARHLAVTNLIAPRGVKRTLGQFRRVITDY